LDTKENEITATSTALDLQQSGARDKFCYKRFSARKTEDFGYYQILNFTMEDGNDGTMFSETISPILLHAS
jgi:hypothetical protein